MLPRAALLISILQFALSSFGQLPGLQARQLTGSVGAESAIREAGAKATLEKDAIRVMLPIREVAGPEARVVVWLISPKDMRSGETVATMSANGHAVLATLPWPKDAHGVREEDIGWYRIGYRVEGNGVEHANGVLSVGAITANLLE